MYTHVHVASQGPTIQATCCRQTKPGLSWPDSKGRGLNSTLGALSQAGWGCGQGASGTLPVIQPLLQLWEEELCVELVDGGDVGEDKSDHVLREGLAAAGLPQQLLEEYLQPCWVTSLWHRGGCPHTQGDGQSWRPPEPSLSLLNAFTSLSPIILTTTLGKDRVAHVLATLQMCKPRPKDLGTCERLAVDKCRKWAHLVSVEVLDFARLKTPLLMFSDSTLPPWAP